MKNHSFIIAFSILACAFCAMCGAAHTQDNFQQIYQDGIEAFNQGDYVSAAYFFHRMRETEDWNAYPNRMDILTKLAYIEENQNRFADAADLYGLALQNLPPVDNETQQRLLLMYQQRYADALTRAGDYKQAGEIYWYLYQAYPGEERAMLIKKILHNYQFQTVPIETLDRLKGIILSTYAPMMGWDLAELYQNQGHEAEAVSLFEMFWAAYPKEGLQYTASMAEAYRNTDQIDGLLAAMAARHAEKPEYVVLHAELLKQIEKPEDALAMIETYYRALFPSAEALDASVILEHPSVSQELLVLWIDLTGQIRGPLAAAVPCRQIVDKFPLDLRWRERLSGFLILGGKREDAIEMWTLWVEESAGNPLAQLDAIEQIVNLGQDEQAEELLNNVTDSVPAPIKLQEGKTALQLGLFDRAWAAFEIASVSARMNPAVITYTIVSHAETAANAKSMIASLIQRASGENYNSAFHWIRDSLIESGIQNGMEEQLEALALSEPSGSWRLPLAIAAQKHGKDRWAQRLLETISEDNPLARQAERQLAQLVAKEKTVPEQRLAADLLQKSIADVLCATPPIMLSNLQVEHLLEYADLRLNAFQPGEALTAARLVESSTPRLEQPMLPTRIDELSLLRSRAMAQTGSLEPSRKKLETIQFQPFFSQAQLLNAKILLAEKNHEEAREAFVNLIINPEHWSVADDALRFYIAMEPLVGESMDLFCTAQSYQLQGRFDQAYSTLLELAVAQYGEDAEEWARYEIARLKAVAGDLEGALADWKQLLLNVDHPVYHGLTRYQIIQNSAASETAIDEASQYQQLLMEFPDTLFADLARLKLQERERP